MANRYGLSTRPHHISYSGFLIRSGESKLWYLRKKMRKIGTHGSERIFRPVSSEEHEVDSFPG